MKTIRHLTLLAIAGLFCPPVLPAAWSPDRAGTVCLGRQAQPEAAPVYPRGMAIDTAGGKIYVADDAGNRVLRYKLSAATPYGGQPEAVLGQPDFSSIASGNGPSRLNAPGDVAFQNGSLWVADYGNNRVVRFDNAASKVTGSPADGVLGQASLNTSASGSGRSQMAQPWGLAVDAAGRLYVADNFNNRVLRFDNARNAADGPQASAVFGQSGFTLAAPGNSATGLRNPSGLVVSNGPGSSVSLWVADTGNYRIVRYDNAQNAATGPAASGVLGQDGFGKGAAPAVAAASRFRPQSISLDDAGRLYTTDFTNYRILRFNAPVSASTTAATANSFAAADAVLGQPDFVTGTAPEASQQQDNFDPRGLLCDGAGHLWVADAKNSRLGRINAPLMNDDFSVSLGTEADVHGDTIPGAASIAIDPVNGKVYVADQESSQIFRFASYADLTSGKPAEARHTSGYIPRGLLVSTGGELYCLYGHSVWYNEKPAESLGAFALIFGEASVPGAVNKLNNPNAIALGYYGTLYVADTGNNRVVTLGRNGGSGAYSISRVFGQTSESLSGPGNGEAGLNAPRGVAYDKAAERIWIADTGNHRVVGWEYNASQPFMKPPFLTVLGQANMTDAAAGTAAARLSQPTGMTLDPLGRLWVADSGNHRVVRFNQPLVKGPAQVVIGQKDFVTAAAGTSLRRLSTPSAIAIDGRGCPWIADSGNRRVVRHTPDNPVASSIKVLTGKTQIIFDVEPGVGYLRQYSMKMDVWTDSGMSLAQSAAFEWTPFIVPGTNYFYRIVGP